MTLKTKASIIVERFFEKSAVEKLQVDFLGRPNSPRYSKLAGLY